MAKNWKILLVGVAILAFFSRFWNLNWGAPFYFHPDERNIASAVSQLSLTQLNPHFFAYGSLPIYITYTIGLLSNLVTKLIQPGLTITSVTFEQAIVISRGISALFSLLLIPLLFHIGTYLKNKTTGIIAAFLALTSIGFIQFAHFGTFELWLTLFTLLLFWKCLHLLKHYTRSKLLLTSVILGVLVAVKVSSLVLIPLPLISVGWHLWRRKRDKHLLSTFSQFLFITIFILCITGAIYLFTNPFVLLDSGSFQGSMQYESSVALGTLSVFYTGEFLHKLPVIFQLVHVYPFLLNPVVFFLFLVSFCALCFRLFKERNSQLFLLLIFFLVTFVSQACLYVKWVRYLLPTLPFCYLITALFLTRLIHPLAHPFKHKQRYFFKTTIVFSYLACLIWAGSYLRTTFLAPDPRVGASEWAQKHLDTEKEVTSEVYDLGITPFNSYFPHITLFNFYDLDNNSLDSTPETLKTQLAKSIYLILPSQRILKTRLQNPQAFPLGNNFYRQLLSNQLPYKKIYETPCDLFCQITYVGSPVFAYEETANVFERPEVYIFEKK